MRYHFFVTVWDRVYVEKFIEFSVASQLWEGNLPALSSAADLLYTVYTDRASEPLFEQARASLGRHVELRLRFFEDMPLGGDTLAQVMERSDPAILKHNVQRTCAWELLEEAAKDDDAAVILLDSDFILSAGALSRLHELRLSGKQAVAAMFLRLEEESAVPLLRQACADGGGAGLAGAELVAIGLRAMHPLAHRFFVDEDAFAPYPSQLNWRVGEDGFVTHCFFPHPLMVVPRATRYFSTMDYEYMLRAVPDDDAIHLCRSSDELLVCKMTRESYLAGQDADPPPTLERLAQFAVANTNHRHRLFMGQPVRYRAGGAEEEWEAVERNSTAFIEAVYKGIELMVASVKPGDAQSMVFLKSFLGPIEDFLSPQLHARLKEWIPPARGHGEG